MSAAAKQVADIEHGVSPGKTSQIYPIGFSVGENYIPRPFSGVWEPGSRTKKEIFAKFEDEHKKRFA